MRCAALVLFLAFGQMELRAQTTANFIVLHTFTAPSGTPLANSDGASPGAGVVLSGQMLYGTTADGGSAGFGTIFQMNTDGSNFLTLYNFADANDGAMPMAPLVVTNGMLYGTASAGGSSSFGTIFEFDTSESNFTTLYTFTNGVDGADPVAGLLLSGSNLYGTTPGKFLGPNYGTVFMINTNGSNFSVLHRFSAPSSLHYTNSDGFLLSGPLFLSGSTLYGVATDGGANGDGTLFSMASDGSSFGPTYEFATASGFPLTNGGGANPQGGVVGLGGTLFGATYDGGVNGWGTVYQYDFASSVFSPLYSFTAGADYENPQGPLAASGNMLYGTTPATIFGVNTNAMDFTNLFLFPPTFSDGSGDLTNATGSAPNGGLVLASQTLYGTTQTGGSNGYGTVFAFDLPTVAVPLTIQQTPGAVVLTWNNSAFSLQSAPTLSGTFTNVPGATSPCTNALSASQIFFRLQAN
ncbi:MAG TPA: choice-of-anchor tandem repeat GloVer-containing protein [Verrucomicrobiae bacterium]|jgi:uncharacterized repeat protein (TIGR03803 family)|nr:choice-of-anchor tandem repeat GloVer-containing protein [Verrucomicrobiae bacterium]